MRVLLAVAAVVAALSVVQKAPCIQTQWTDTTVRYSRMCYSDIPYLYTARGLSERGWPYASHDRYPAMEYPVVIAYFAWGTAALLAPVGAGPPAAERAAAGPDGQYGLPGMVAEANQYFLLSAVLLLTVGLIATWLLAGVHRRRPWDALPYAAAPALLLTGLVNWDLLSVVFVAGALWAWARGRPVLTGVMIGLGTATKLYPLFLLGGVLVICLRRRDRRQAYADLARVGLTAAAAWILANLPGLVSSPERWKVFWSFNSARGPDLGSLWLAASLLGHPAVAHTVNIVSWAFFALACLAVLVLGLRAPVTPRLAQLGFLVVAAFLLVNKVYSPQYVLWLLPLAVLARPRWRDLLIWQAGEVLYFAAVWIYLGGWSASGTSGAPDPLYLVAIGVRVAAELYLMGMVVRDVLRPEHDPVREERSPRGQPAPALS